MVMSFSKTESVSLHLSGRNNFPPLLPQLLKVNYNYYLNIEIVHVHVHVYYYY